MFKQEMSLKDISILALVAVLFSGAEQFVQFDRVHYEEHFCDIILNLE